MRWMRLAGIIGIIFLVLSVGFSIYGIISTLTASPEAIMQGVSQQEEIGISLIILFISIAVLAFASFLLFYWGFFKMGWHIHNFLLKITSLVMIGIPFIILMIIGIVWVQQAMSGVMTSLTSWPAYFMIFIFLLFLINVFLFYIGLIKAGKEIRFARLAGILGIIAFIISFLSFCVLIYLFLNPMVLISLLFSFADVMKEYLWIFILTEVFLTVLGWAILLFISLSLFDASKKFENI